MAFNAQIKRNDWERMSEKEQEFVEKAVTEAQMRIEIVEPTLTEATVNKVLEVAQGWNWDNYTDEKTGKPWSVLEALFCKLSWVAEYLEHLKDVDEYADIIQDTKDIVEALQADIKF